MRAILAAAILGLCLPAYANQQPPAETRTAKERMKDKASDEQRVNDCNVPPERRTRPRPTACPDRR